MEQEMLQRLVTNVVREMRLPSRSEGRGSHVLTLVDAVLDAALDEEATDIHLEPMEEGLRIRVRVDAPLSEPAAGGNRPSRYRTSKGDGGHRHGKAQPSTGWADSLSTRGAQRRYARGGSSRRGR